MHQILSLFTVILSSPLLSSNYERTYVISQRYLLPEIAKSMFISVITKTPEYPEPVEHYQKYLPAALMARCPIKQRDNLIFMINWMALQSRGKYDFQKNSTCNHNVRKTPRSDKYFRRQSTSKRHVSVRGLKRWSVL